MQDHVIQLPAELHPDTAKLVVDFATELGAKLRKAEVKYGYSNKWLTDEWERICSEQLHSHLAKGDPRDVAIYAAFMWARGWATRENPALVAAREEIDRLNQALYWEQNRSDRVNTHGEGCHAWGNRHYECLLKKFNAEGSASDVELNRLRKSNEARFRAILKAMELLLDVALMEIPITEENREILLFQEAMMKGFSDWAKKIGLEDKLKGR